MRIVLGLFLLLNAVPLFSWGEAGHKIVGEIARRHLDEDTLRAVEEALDGATFDEASVWMDEVRKEKRYYHMVSWHYINMEKGQKYDRRTKEENAVNALRDAVKKLNNKHKYSKKEIAVLLKIVFHLVGDLHQPLHTGYGSDRGGNNVPVEINGKATNLHGLWDYEIIALKKITAGDCMALEAAMSEKELQHVKRLNVFIWHEESRSYVEQAYKISGGVIDQNYLETQSLVMKKQMLKGGIRLAAILTRIFKRKEKPVESDDPDGRLPSALNRLQTPIWRRHSLFA